MCECLHARDGNEDSEARATCPRSLSMEGEHLDFASSALLTTPQSVPDSLIGRTVQGLAVGRREEALSHPSGSHFKAWRFRFFPKVKP